jgi:hypothetical protein
MRPIRLACAAAMLLLAGCASAPQEAPVSLINSLSFDNPMSGMRDGLRSAWPLTALSHARENFPLAQVRQCASAGVCSWGVLSAHRSFGKVRRIAGGVAVELDLEVDVDRSQSVARSEQVGAMSIPADVGALHARRRVQHEVVLPFGKVERIDLDYGIRFELCAFRLDAARQPMEQCEIPYF